MEGQELEQKHTEMLNELIKPGQDIITEMTPQKANLMHMAMGTFVK